MGTISQAKTYGGIGSILVLLSFIPTVGWILAIVGFILTVLAIKYISESVNDPAIFRNAIIAYVIAIVGIVVVGVVVAAAIFGFVGLGALAGGRTGAATGGVVGVIASVVAALVVIWILLILSGYFIRKTYNSISAKLNVGMFRTAALVYFIGAALTIILVGFIILLVAQILLVIAYFSIPDTLPSSPGMPPPPTSGAPTMATSSGMPASGQKFCVKCGAALAQDAMFCPSCGASQPKTM
jgi:uncharacterized membrane protein